MVAFVTVTVNSPVGADHHLATLCLPVARRLDLQNALSLQLQHQVRYISDCTLVHAWDVAFSRKEKPSALKMGAAGNCSSWKVLECYGLV